MPQSCDMGQTALLSLRRKACWGFFRPKNPTASARFEPVNLGTRGQHSNHQTTEAAITELVHCVGYCTIIVQDARSIKCEILCTVSAQQTKLFSCLCNHLFSILHHFLCCCMTCYTVDIKINFTAATCVLIFYHDIILWLLCGLYFTCYCLCL
jgi:hypothetical protein